MRHQHRHHHTRLRDELRIPKGDLTTGGLVHDTFGRLTADGNVRFTYDGADRPTTRDLSPAGNTDRFTYLADTTSITSDSLARYTNSPGGQPTGLWQGNTAVYLGADRHGDTVTQHNTTTGARTSSRAYDPFGTPTATYNDLGGPSPKSWAGNLGYQSDWTDPTTKRVNMGARWYTPSTATFTTRDTLTLPLKTHISPNRYTYAAASPLNYIDPTGHCDEVIGNTLVACGDLPTPQQTTTQGTWTEACPNGGGCPYDTGWDTDGLGSEPGYVNNYQRLENAEVIGYSQPSVPRISPASLPSLPPARSIAAIDATDIQTRRTNEAISAYAGSGVIPGLREAALQRKPLGVNPTDDYLCANGGGTCRPFVAGVNAFLGTIMPAAQMFYYMSIGMVAILAVTVAAPVIASASLSLSVATGLGTGTGTAIAVETVAGGIIGLGAYAATSDGDFDIKDAIVATAFGMVEGYAGAPKATTKAAGPEAQAVADKAQQANPRPGTAAALVTPDGRVWSGTSKKGAAAPVHHPVVEAELLTIPPDPRMPGAHGRCAEPACISSALESGVEVRGGRIASAQVRSPGNPAHGKPIPPCTVCKELLRRLDIEWAWW